MPLTDPSWDAAPVFLRPDVAGHLLGVSPAHVRHLLRIGALHGLHVGRLWRVPLDDVRDYAARNNEAENRKGMGGQQTGPAQCHAA